MTTEQTELLFKYSRGQKPANRSDFTNFCIDPTAMGLVSQRLKFYIKRNVTLIQSVRLDETIA